jgi:hypothetical protein
VVERKLEADVVSVEICLLARLFTGKAVYWQGCLLARLREVELSAQEKHQIHFSEHKFFGKLPLFIIHPQKNVRLTR